MLRPAWDWGPLLDEDRITAGYKPMNDTEMKQLTKHDYAETANCYAVSSDPPYAEPAADGYTVSSDPPPPPMYNAQSDTAYSQEVEP